MATPQHSEGEWVIVKIGGELAMDVPRLAATVGRAVRERLSSGSRVAIIHGGGPQASDLQARLGLEPQKVAGQRITDAATLEVMKMTVGGQVSVDVARALRLAGVPALCTTGVSGGLVDAVKRPPVRVQGEAAPVDYGLVGDVVAVNVAALEAIAGAGLVPVLGSLAGDAEGRVLNVNADTVAAEVARALRAARLVLVSNVPGVLRDRSDPSTRIPRLTPEAARRRIADGSIVGGMIPKVEESLALLEAGVGAVHIVGLEPDTALLDELAAPGSCGTAFVPSDG